MLKSLINFFMFLPDLEEKTPKILCDENKCTCCGKCQQICPVKAVMVDKGSRLYYSYRCNTCNRCLEVCPSKALELIGA